MNKATKEEYVSLLQRIAGDPSFFDMSIQGNLLGVGAAFQALEENYSKPPRAYHTLEHVSWVLRRIDDMADEDSKRGSTFFDQEKWDAIRLAAWFHDYDLTGSPRDEENSAKLVIMFGTVLHLKEPVVNSAARLILATKHERIPLEHDESILCDCDLAILGADEESFDHYEALVRKEWEHVPEHLFRTARQVILEKFAKRPWIFMTEYGRTRWERRARSNLHRSITRLADANAPIPTIEGKATEK